MRARRTREGQGNHLWLVDVARYTLISKWNMRHIPLYLSRDGHEVVLWPSRRVSGRILHRMAAQLMQDNCSWLVSQLVPNCKYSFFGKTVLYVSLFFLYIIFFFLFLFNLNLLPTKRDFSSEEQLLWGQDQWRSREYLCFKS